MLVLNYPSYKQDVGKRSYYLPFSLVGFLLLVALFFIGSVRSGRGQGVQNGSIIDVTGCTATFVFVAL